jgi:hypothetical protein
MEKEFIPYQQALDLRELGFDEPCFAFYQKEYHEDAPIMVFDKDEYRLTGFRTCKNSEIPYHYTAAPLYQQAFKWFRKNKIRSSVSEFDINNYMYFIDDGINRDIEVPGYDTYEEAELACLINLIEIVKEKK